MGIDLKRKLSSRKFWAAMTANITAVMAAFNVSDSAIVQVTSVVAGIGALVVYVLAEAYVDGKNKSSGGDTANIADGGVKVE